MGGTNRLVDALHSFDTPSKTLARLTSLLILNVALLKIGATEIDKLLRWSLAQQVVEKV